MGAANLQRGLRDGEGGVGPATDLAARPLRSMGPMLLSLKHAVLQSQGIPDWSCLGARLREDTKTLA